MFDKLSNLFSGFGFVETRRRAIKTADTNARQCHHCNTGLSGVQKVCRGCLTPVATVGLASERWVRAELSRRVLHLETLDSVKYGKQVLPASI